MTKCNRLAGIGLFYAILLLWLDLGQVPSVRAGQTVVDAGTSWTFTVPATATNYAWRLDGSLVSTNGMVGTNGPNFTYWPTRYDVGTHLLTCYQTFSNATTGSALWQVRVRIPLPTPTNQYFLATNGSDANAGTLLAPFLTLERARNAIRTNGVPAGGVVVYLRGGTYWRTNTFLLTNIDSGTASSPVIYAAYPGETPVLSAGKPILGSAFTPLNASQTNRVAVGVNPTNILELDLASAGVTHFHSFPSYFNTWVTTNVYATSGSGGLGELFYNGQRMWLSRYPDHDLTNDNLNTPFMLMDGVAATGPGSTNYLNGPGIYTNSAGVPVSVGGALHYYPSNDTEVARWAEALTNGGVWISGFWRVAWQNDAVRLLGIDYTNRVLELTNTTQVPNGLGGKYTRPQGSFSEPFWVMNLLEDMDLPGTWAVDFNRNKLYFYAPTNHLADGSVVLSDFGAPLVQLTQTTNVVLKSLALEDGLGQGIYVTNGVNNLVVGCTLRNLNNYPVEFYGGYTNGVVDCWMGNLSGGGVFLRGGDDTTNPRTPARHFVVNNVITNSGVIARVYATPIDCGFGGEVGGSGGGGHTLCVGMRVAHNLITISPQVAILHGSWDNTFEYNNLAADGQTWGGISDIYSYDQFGRCGNDNIRYNFIHDSAQCGALGFDSDHWAEHIYGNIADQTPAGLGTGPGTQATAGHQQYADFYNNLTANNYQVYGGLDLVSPVPAIMEENAAIDCVYPYIWQLVTVGVNSNLVTTSSAAVMQSGPNLTYTSDPGFINFSNEDFRLIPGATIYSDMPKFQNIPFEMIGTYNDETVTNLAARFSPYPTTAPATALGPGSATLNGTLVYPQFDSNTTVFVYWGTSDGGTNAAAWSQVISLGVQDAGALSTNLTGLQRVPYYYRIFATNVAGQTWAASSVTFTPYAPGHTPANLIWNGDGVSNVWDGNVNDLVWRNTNTPAPFWDGDTVNFTDSGTNVPAVNLDAPVQPAWVDVNATQNYTFAGVGKISGVTALQKDGPGTLTLVTTNDYTGATLINQGVLQVGDGTNSGGLGTGPITNNATLRFNQPGNTTLAGAVYGSGGLTKTGGGTLTLAANNGYSSTTTVSGGAVAITSDANLGAAGAGLLLDGGTLQVTSGGLMTFNNRPVTLNSGGGTLSLANTLTVTNPITGPGALTVQGGGTLVLTASNHYAGLTTVSAGVLQIDAGAGTGSVATNLFLNGGSLLYGRPDNVVPPGYISGNSSSSAINNQATSGALTLNFAPGSNTFATVFNSSSNALILIGGSNYLLNLGTDLANKAANETLVLSNGYWFTPRIGANGGPYMLGTNVLTNATLESSGARGVRGNFQILNGGVLRLNSVRYPNAVNENRFDLGANTMSAGEMAAITLAPGGLLDVWLLQYDGLNLNPSTAGTASVITQNGGTALVGVNGSGNSNGNLVFNAAAANTLAEYVLNGGLLKVAGTVSATLAASGGTNLFWFKGGTLAVNTFNTTNFWLTLTNTLLNPAGTLAPGDLGTAGETVILGNYVCSNAATLALDVGGLTPASAFSNAPSCYDFISVAGTATLAGSLNVNLLNNYIPATNSSFTVLTAVGGLGGAFTNLVNNRVSVGGYANASFLVVTTATSVVLTNFQLLQASFIASVTNGATPLVVTFTDTSLGSVTNRSWNFGDGTTTNTTSPSVTHSFTIPGTNQVTLTVGGSLGTNSASLTVVAYLGTPPVLGPVTAVGTNLVITGSNGNVGASCYVLSAPNLMLPAASWTIIATNQFGPGGVVNFTNPLNPNAPQNFFRLRLR